MRRFGPPSRILLVSALFLLSCLQYANSLGNDFVWDAEGVFLEDPSIRDLSNIPSFFAKGYRLAPHGVIAGGTVERSGLTYYRPLVKTLHAIEFHFLGTAPAGYKLANILLNGCVVAAAFLFLEAVTGSTFAAFLASVLYAVNPSRAEAVYWTYSDSVILAALFSLLSLFLYRKKKYVPALAVFAFALLSHETAVLLPLVCILLEYLLPEGESRQGYLRPLPFVLLACVYLVVRRGAAGPVPLTQLDALSLFNAGAVIVKKYLKLLLVPDGPVTVYRYRSGAFESLTPEIAVSYAVLGGFALLGGFLWRAKKREYLFWLLWFFVLISFTFNVGNFGDYLLAEKNLYLACLGPCAAAARFAVSRRRTGAATLLVLAAFAVYHSAETFRRGFYWKDTVTYLEQALSFSPDFSLGRIALANKLASGGEYDRAAAEYARVAGSRPELAGYMKKLMGEAYFNKGNELASQGRYGQALAEYDKALPLKEDVSSVYNNVGNVHYVLDDQKGAAAAWEKALRADPSNAEACYNMAMALEKEGRIVDALVYYQRFLSLAPARAPEVSDRVEGIRKRARERAPRKG